MDDLEVDDFGDFTSKKKINSGRKGKNGERQLVKILNTRFNDILTKNPTWGCFSRSVGSGNRFGQVTGLSKTATEFYSGDIICDNFKFVIESKSGYDIDFITAFEGNAQIDKFLDQVTNDSNRCKKMAMLIYKKDRKAPLVFIKRSYPLEERQFQYRMYYRDWMVVVLSELLKLEDGFFFNEPLPTSLNSF